MCKPLLFHFDVRCLANGMLPPDTMLFLTLVSYPLLYRLVEIELMRWYFHRYVADRSGPEEVEKADMEARDV